MKKLSVITLFIIINFAALSQGLNDVCSPSTAYVYAVGNSGQFFKSTNRLPGMFEAITVKFKKLSGCWQVKN